jgi:hypothetical protein
MVSQLDLPTYTSTGPLLFSLYTDHIRVRGERAEYCSEEYKSLQRLHLWSPRHVRPDQISLTFDDEIHLLIPCVDYTPDFAQSKVELVEKGGKARRYPWEATRGIFEVYESALEGVKKAKGYQTLPLVCLFTLAQQFIGKGRIDVIL